MTEAVSVSQPATVLALASQQTHAHCRTQAADEEHVSSVTLRGVVCGEHPEKGQHINAIGDLADGHHFLEILMKRYHALADHGFARGLSERTFVWKLRHIRSCEQ